MYCHYCGRPATAKCPICDHWICPAHRRSWLFAAFCRKCYPAVSVGTVSVAVVAAGAAAVYFMAFHG
jgi:hypothetical protein